MDGIEGNKKMTKNDSRKTVLFINPPGLTKGLNSGLGILSAVLLECGVECYTLDLNNGNLERQMIGEMTEETKIDFGLIRKEILERSPEFVCLPVMSLLSSKLAGLVKFIKSKFPEKTVVVGGPHISFEGETFVKESGADIGIVGEGEAAIVEIVGGTPLSEIKGIFYAVGGKRVSKTEPRKFETNLDSLPFPSYDNFSSVIKSGGVIRDYPLLTSRGCPYNCTFCCVHRVIGKKWRARSPENVVSELKLAKEKYGISRVAIIDDNFTLDRNRALRICDLVIKEKLGLEMRCLGGVRADKLDLELLKKMKEAGFLHLSIGIESVNPLVFSKIKKGESLEAIKKAIENAKKAGIRMNGYFVIGLPYSTYESDLESIKFAKEAGITAWWGIATPFPHTELWEWVNGHGRWLKDFKMNPPSGIEEVAFDTPDYPAERRLDAFRRARVVARTFDRLEGGYAKRFQACLRYDPTAIVGYHYWLLRRAAGKVASKVLELR